MPPLPPPPRPPGVGGAAGVADQGHCKSPYGGKICNDKTLSDQGPAFISQMPSYATERIEPKLSHSPGRAPPLDFHRSHRADTRAPRATAAGHGATHRLVGPRSHCGASALFGRTSGAQRSSTPTTLYAASGRLIPFNSNSPTGSTFTASSTFIRTRGLMRICPGRRQPNNSSR